VWLDFVIFITLKKRGPVIGISGLILVIISFSIMLSVFPASNVTDRSDFYVPSMFKGMFNQVSDNLQILPGDSGYFSYDPKSSDVSLLWGVQIIDYTDGDELSVSISDIYGDDYGEFSQDGPIIFEMLQLKKSDTLNFKIQNHGSRTINIVVMISEDPDNSGAFSNPNSPFVSTVLPLIISGILLLLGIILLVIGMVLSIIDWKNMKKSKQYF